MDLLMFSELKPADVRSSGPLINMPEFNGSGLDAAPKSKVAPDWSDRLSISMFMLASIPLKSVFSEAMLVGGESRPEKSSIFMPAAEAFWVKVWLLSNRVDGGVAA